MNKLKNILIALIGVAIPVAMVLTYKSIALANHLSGSDLIEKMIRGLAWGAVIDVSLALIVVAILITGWISGPDSGKGEEDEEDGE